MAVDDNETLANHKIEISSVDVDAVFHEEDEVDIALDGDKITKIVITPKKDKSRIEINLKNPICPSKNKPGKPDHKKTTTIWELEDENSYHIKSITRYGCAGNKYVYTFHWNTQSISSGSGNFSSLLLKFFWGGLSGKSGSGGGLMK
jgi:hypothetical protein